MVQAIIFLTWWWRHQMETFSASLALCAGKSPVSGEFPSQRQVTRSFGVFFDLRLIKRLSKQSWGWWFETPSRSLWRHHNDDQNIVGPSKIKWFYSPQVYILHHRVPPIWQWDKSTMAVNLLVQTMTQWVRTMVLYTMENYRHYHFCYKNGVHIVWRHQHTTQYTIFLIANIFFIYSFCIIFHVNFYFCNFPLLISLTVTTSAAQVYVFPMCTTELLQLLTHPPLVDQSSGFLKSITHNTVHTMSRIIVPMAISARWRIQILYTYVCVYVAGS